jgi:hypothetical protein
MGKLEVQGSGTGAAGLPTWQRALEGAVHLSQQRPSQEIKRLRGGSLQEAGRQSSAEANC